MWSGFDIGEEVFLKCKVVGIRLHDDETVTYTVKFDTNSTTFDGGVVVDGIVEVDLAERVQR